MNLFHEPAYAFRQSGMNSGLDDMATYCTDWLASDPIFYNQKTGKVSRSINDVIDFPNLEFDPEGLSNYLAFGYSVFEQTPIKDVKFLRHSSRLTINGRGIISVERLEDPAEALPSGQATEHDTIELLRARVRDWENTVDGPIVIPISGGYDSRILALLVKDKSRIRSFTYGLSDRQVDHFEVVRAKKASEIMGTHWRWISLGNYHNYFQDWDRLFGPSTHAHGMHHFEFFGTIRPTVPPDSPILSGINGDAWAGKLVAYPLREPKDLIILGNTKGLAADSSQCCLQHDGEQRLGYWEEHKEKLADPLYYMISLVRMKSMLLCYLKRVPTALGFQVWTPFHDIDVASAMLTLPPDRRRNRAWQRDLFRRHGLDLEALGLRAARADTINHHAMKRVPLAPLDAHLLREAVNPSYVEWINRRVVGQRPLDHGKRWMLGLPKVGGAMRRLGISDDRLTAYRAYLTLRPIENAIRMRSVAQKDGIGAVFGRPLFRDQSSEQAAAALAPATEARPMRVPSWPH